MRARSSWVIAMALVSIACANDPPPFAAPHDAGPVDAFVPQDVGADTGPADVGVDAPDVGTDAGCTLGTVQNCLTCGDMCPNVANTTPTCGASGCTNPCNMGFDDCDMIAGNGCETPTATDLHNCGTCGTNCTFAGVNVMPTCTAGTCMAHCQSGYGDCNGDLMAATSDGCEINTNTSLLHCGACGSPCTLPGHPVNASPVCSSGTCRMQCTMGFSDCNGSVLDGCEHTGTTCP